MNRNSLGRLKAINWKSPIFSTVIAMLILIFAFTLMNPTFLTWDNFKSIFLNASIIGIFAAGVTMVIISGNIDLSTASTAAVAVMAFGLLYKLGVPTAVGVLAGLLAGALCGLINGLLIAKARLFSMMVTIANMLTYRALAYSFTDLQSVTVTDINFFAFGRMSVLGVPISVFYMVVFFLIMSYVLGHTPFGRRVYAIGGSLQASYYCGINIDRTIIQTFVVMGTISAFAGLVTAAQTAAATPIIMNGREFDFISPCVIGGIAMSGGKGKILGTFFGCILLAVVANGMVLVGLQSYWQNLVKGLILIFAMWVDALRNRQNLA